MHIPGKFKQDNIDVLVNLMREYPFATVITSSNSAIEA
ncbi:FMN-binding negative transcriptional regulator, partial [Vibrio cholerae]|nr:FMN-binding negative transcriptional regulator [Vibrio cholerae]